MKIIFDSEEQKEDFIKRNCPGYFNLPEYCILGAGCSICWERAAELVVKGEDKNDI